MRQAFHSTWIFDVDELCQMNRLKHIRSASPRNASFQTQKDGMVFEAGSGASGLQADFFILSALVQN
jgi:hypothetical protein